MCQARDHNATAEQRQLHAHSRLDQAKTAFGWPGTSQGSASKAVMRDKCIQAEVRPNVQTRMLLPSLAVLAFCLLLNQIGLFVPIIMIARNCVLPKTPKEVRPKYPTCSESMLAKEMTIVVSVKDACSQAPGFIKALEVFAPPSVHQIYTFPNFESCAKIDL